MVSPTNERPPTHGAELEEPLAAVEAHLGKLGEALRTRDTDAIERHASELHRSLARAVDRFTVAARTGSIPMPLRNRLATAGGEVAAQRESLARATAALDRAIDVLLPRDASSLYSALGAPERAMQSGMIQA